MHAGGVALDCVITDNFPLEHLKNIRNAAGGLETPILRRWIASEEPQLFEIEHPGPDVPETWLTQFRHTGLKNIAAHAIYDTVRCVGTYHSFYGLPAPLNATHADLLTQLCPAMHEALCGVIAGLTQADRFAEGLATLTKREREIVHCISQGRSNREIAEMVHLSETTVKHHLLKIFTKLNVVSRAQLTSQLAAHAARVKPEYGVELL